jgi:hypothetical protein
MDTLADGSFIFLAGVLVFLVGAVIALYTRRGSAMDLHPYHHVHGGAPGANLPTRDYSGSDRTRSTEQHVVARWTRAPQNEAGVRAEAAERSRRERAAQRTRRKAMRIPSPLPPRR